MDSKTVKALLDERQGETWTGTVERGDDLDWLRIFEDPDGNTIVEQSPGEWLVATDGNLVFEIVNIQHLTDILDKLAVTAPIP